MNNLNDLRKQLRELASEGYVFRGETRQRPAVHPTLGRLRSEFPNDPGRTAQIRGQAYTILRWSRRIKSQVLADITEDQWYALLRHYGWPVPFLDVTFDYEVAIWFSLLTRKEGSEPSVIYAIPPCKTPDSLRLISHDDLQQDSEYADLNCRWSVQRGGALMPTGWPDMTSAEQFDMLTLPGLRSFPFVPTPSDRANVSNLLSTAGDGVAHRLRSLLGTVAQVVGGLEAIDPYLRDRIETLG